jgi:hypothetical protein
MLGSELREAVARGKVTHLTQVRRETDEHWFEARAVSGLLNAAIHAPKAAVEILEPPSCVAPPPLTRRELDVFDCLDEELRCSARSGNLAEADVPLDARLGIPPPNVEMKPLYRETRRLPIVESRHGSLGTISGFFAIGGLLGIVLGVLALVGGLVLGQSLIAICGIGAIGSGIGMIAVSELLVVMKDVEESTRATRLWVEFQARRMFDSEE